MVFSEEHGFSKTQLVKNTFSPIPEHIFQKRCHFWFWASPAETNIFIVLPGFLGPKKCLAKTDSVHENAFFSLPDTNNVRHILLKIYIVHFLPFWRTTLKYTTFIGFCLFRFVFLFFCFCFSVSNIKRQKKKTISIREPHFRHPDNFAKTLFGAKWRYLCFWRYPRNTVQGREKNEKEKHLDQCLTLSLD